MADGFARTYNAELLFDETPQVKKADLLGALRQWCGRVEPLDGNATSDLLSFVYPDHPVVYADTTAYAQIFLAVSPTGLVGGTAEAALQQSWDWPEAKSVVTRCRSTMLVTDLMSGGLEYKERLALFQKALSAVLEVVPCLGIHWLPSQQFVSPSAYQASKRPSTFDRLFPAINVRLFNISNGAGGETLMDTVGLAALGVPDLQCHFLGLDANAVGRVLHNTAYYLFDHGDVIADGQTIQGIRAEDRWRCQHEDALVGPERTVVDINSGKRYTAGNRH